MVPPPVARQQRLAEARMALLPPQRLNRWRRWRRWDVGYSRYVTIVTTVTTYIYYYKVVRGTVVYVCNPYNRTMGNSKVPNCEIPWCHGDALSPGNSTD